MDSSITEILMSALGGGAAANILGMLIKNRNMGPLWNTILGAAGGIAGGMAMDGMQAGVGGDLLGGALGGVVLTLIGSFLKKKKSPAA